MTDLICKTHKRELRCIAGTSAHPDNWYCPECDAQEQIASLKLEVADLTRQLRAEQGECYECGGEMVPGQYIRQTFTGIGDFYDDDEACTMSPGGSGELVECMKCKNCGWSKHE